jgi:hypothetical protein
MAVVGACILDANALATVRGKIGPDAFFSADNREIFRTVCEMSDAGKKIDAVTVLSEIRQRGIAEEVGERPYLVDLLQSVPDVANASQYAQTLLDRHRDRQALVLLETAARRMRMGKVDGVVDDVIATTAAKLAALVEPAKLRSGAGPIVTCMADVQPREISWLWPGRIALGRITLLVGHPGAGKSIFTTDIAARVSTGTSWPDGAICPQGSVILMSAEDDPGDTIRPRLDAHGADVRKVHLLNAVRYFDKDSKQLERMFTLADLPALEDTLRRHPDCKLVVVDPIGSFIGGDTDSHRDNEVRGVLSPVAMLAEKNGVAMLAVCHTRKSAGTRADDMALGSRAFTGLARAVWHLSIDPDNQDRRLLLAGKNNLAKQGTGLAFTIGGQPAAINWEREPVEMSADDALAKENGAGDTPKPGPEPVVRSMAADWLRELLGDLEEHLVATVKEAAEAAGVGSWKSVQRAAQEIGVISHRGTFGGGYVWRLPKRDNLQDSLQDKSLEKDGTCPPVLQGDLLAKSADSAGQDPLQDKLNYLGPQGADAPQAGRQEVVL